MQGTSLRSLLMNCIFQTVILLYLFDNDTSYMILISSSIGLAIEYWKLSKTVNYDIVWTQTVSYLAIPKIKFRFVSSYMESSTQQHDKEAINHLLFIISPILVGYSIYSLKYQKYKSYYSWILNSVVGFIYVFGFVLMTPQLYVNYKLKSVAHMPWKSMVYKTLGTFIDGRLYLTTLFIFFGLMIYDNVDLFAFIIKMPLLHRLACFRDDIIFFIYLYQV